MAKPGSLLLERERELASLDALIEEVESGQAQVGLVEGSAGIGKSCLLGELRERAAGRGFRVLAGRAGALEREFAFGTVRQVFDPALIDPGKRERLLTGAAAGAGPVFSALE
jgi:predicted ATPase